MTAPFDPFATGANGETSVPEIDPADAFTSPTRSAYPRLAELMGRVLIMTPVKFDQTVKPGSKSDMQDRAHVDVSAFDPTSGEWDEYEAMYWSQTSIVRVLRSAHRNRKPAVGVLTLVPAMAAKRKFADTAQLLEDEDIQRWLARGGVGTPPFNVAWVLEPLSPEQLQIALKYYMSKNNPFGS